MVKILFGYKINDDKDFLFIIMKIKLNEKDFIYYGINDYNN